MSKEIAGKIFSTPEEAGVTPPTAEEMEKYNRMFQESERIRNSTPPEKRTMASPKFWEETPGTEFDPNRNK
ncbi:hypothetical protein [Nocardia stercoris]|uniref:Uncharacterized protein n=1 Tax=Nocardia stercoris TaxID=2483361 RepID=A0A3M2KZI2_9NOCA|nr:hypothetical protein [Nocardia stercoris]RMI29850.1 hypothetical protein EBN03_23935 [Nocardia stercoris]